MEQHQTRPDVITLSRAVGEALQGIVSKEPAQVISVWVEKAYACESEDPHVRVEVCSL